MTEKTVHLLLVNSKCSVIRPPPRYYVILSVLLRWEREERRSVEEQTGTWSDVQVCSCASPGGPCGEPLPCSGGRRHCQCRLWPPDRPQYALAFESGQCQQRPWCTSYNQERNLLNYTKKYKLYSHKVVIITFLLMNRDGLISTFNVPLSAWFLFSWWEFGRRGVAALWNKCNTQIRVNPNPNRWDTL